MLMCMKLFFSKMKAAEYLTVLLLLLLSIQYMYMSNLKYAIVTEGQSHSLNWSTCFTEGVLNKTRSL